MAGVVHRDPRREIDVTFSIPILNLRILGALCINASRSCAFGNGTITPSFQVFHLLGETDTLFWNMAASKTLPTLRAWQGRTVDGGTPGGIPPV